MKLNNHKMMLITTVVLFSLGLGVYLAEGVNPNCCGGLLPGVHYLESDTKVPKIIKRCVKPDPNNPGETLWNSLPYKNHQTLGGEGECIPLIKVGIVKWTNEETKFKDGVKNISFRDFHRSRGPRPHEGDEVLT